MRKWVEQTWGRMFTVLSTQSSTQQGKYATARLLQIQQTGIAGFLHRYTLGLLCMRNQQEAFADPMFA